MATSSIFANFNINDNETAEAFAEALAQSAADQPPMPKSSNAVYVTEPDELKRMMARRKKRKHDQT